MSPDNDVLVKSIKSIISKLYMVDYQMYDFEIDIDEVIHSLASETNDAIKALLTSDKACQETLTHLTKYLQLNVKLLMSDEISNLEFITRVNAVLHPEGILAYILIEMGFSYKWVAFASDILVALFERSKVIVKEKGVDEACMDVLTQLAKIKIIIIDPNF